MRVQRRLGGGVKMLPKGAEVANGQGSGTVVTGVSFRLDKQSKTKNEVTHFQSGCDGGGSRHHSASAPPNPATPPQAHLNLSWQLPLTHCDRGTHGSGGIAISAKLALPEPAYFLDWVITAQHA